MSAVPLAVMPEAVDVAVLDPSAGVVAGETAATEPDVSNGEQLDFVLTAVDLQLTDDGSLAGERGGVSPPVDPLPNREADVAPLAETVSFAGTVEPPVATENATSARHELVFVDPQIADYESLLHEISSIGDATRQIEVVLLSSQRDGVDQIAQVLAGYHDLDAVHFVTHGTDRAVQLGATWLQLDNLAAHSGTIAQWGDSLSSEGDLLFYGCRLAGSDAGRELLESIQALTNADIAASTDDTGSALLGGDWWLEHQAGSIETRSLFGPPGELDRASVWNSQWTGLLNTFVVTTTADSGAGSLRQALTDANALPGLDTITFNITGAGPHTISLASALPVITDAVFIDGWSEPSFAGTPVLVLDGNDLTADGLTLAATADGSTIRGLVIRDFNGDGIMIVAGADNNTIVGNFIGRLTETGLDAGIAEANSFNGLRILGANNTIGGTAAGTGNVLSGNNDSGITITGSAATGNVVAGNRIGTNAAGTAVIANSIDGILIDAGAANNTIGGTTTAARNIISGNADDGVELDNGATGNLILGNFIGTDITGTVDFGNQSDGVLINASTTNNQIGGTLAGAGNTIAFSVGIGVDVISGAGSGNSVLGNSIHSNGAVGIDLNGDGVTANDVGDGDTGPNDLQNFPILGRARTDDFSSVTVSGTLNSTAGTTFRVEFFASSTADPSGFGEGERFLGFATVTTNASGDASFTQTLSASVAPGEVITATATNSATGDTSEFSASIGIHGVVVTPISGLLTTEAGASESFSVVLNLAPTANVTINLSSSDTTEGTASAATLTFTTANWSVAQTVTVTGVDDSVNDGDVAFTILTAAASSTDAGYSGLNAADVSATNSDNDPASSTATAFWNQSGLNTPQYNEWDGVSFGVEGNSASVGQWRIIDGAEAPTRDEKILLGVDAAGVISGEFWNGTSWAALPFALDTVSSSTNHGFDVAYESQSGHALIVWNNGTTGSAPLSYRTWDGSTWSSEQTIATPQAGEAVELQLAANPLTDEMTLVVNPTNANIDYALVWNGSSWGNAITLDSTTGVDRTEIGVAYESLSGQALVVYDADGTTNALAYRTWDGLAWSAQQSLAAPSGVAAGSDVSWTSLASDPTSDRIALGAVADGNEIWFSVWDGGAWGDGLTASTTAASFTARDVAVAFESNSGDLLAAYAENANEVRYRTWTSGGGWSSELNGPNIGGTPSTMTLSANLSGNQIMLSVMETNSDIHFVHWSGSAWGSDNQLESNSGESQNQPFLFLFDEGASFDATGNSLWLSTTGDKSNPGLPGVNSVSDGEALRFGDPNLNLEPGTTSGTFSHIFNLDAFAADGSVDLDALEYVSRFMTIGSGANTLNLQTGDVLISTLDDETLGGLAVLDDEVILFRPNTLGDYSSGTFTIVLDNFGTIHGGNDTWSLALVEQNTTVGDVTLTAGSFLFSREGGSEDNDVRLFVPTGVGVGATAGAVSVLIEGDQINIGQKVYGLELVDNNTTLGGVTLNAGAILMTLEGDDSSTGSNSIATKKEDVFFLTVTQTTLGSGTAVANATLLLQGIDVGLDSGDEALDALTLFTSNQPPTISNLAGDSLAYSEGDGAVVIDQGNNAAVTDVDSANFDTGTLTVSFAAGSDNAEDVLSIRHQGIGAGQIGVSGSNVTFGGTTIGSFSGGSGGANLVVTFNSNATAAATQALLRNVTYQNTDIDNPTAGARTVRVVLTDGDGGTSGNYDATVTVSRINDAPVITSNGGGANASISIAENTTAVTTVASSDVDGGTPSYSIFGGADAACFSIDSSTGVLSLSTVPDFEAPVDADGNNVYDVVVRASDGAGGTDNQAIAVTITPVNDNSPVITSNGGGASAAISIAENSTAVTTVTATDADLPIQSLTYSISGGADAALFTIDGSTGALSFLSAPNRESPSGFNGDNVYLVTVQASDGTFSDTQALSISVTDVDEFDVGVVTDTNAASNSVNENAANGTTVGITASASDADATNNGISYSLDDDAGGRFAIGGASGVVTVANGTLLDRETAASYDITIRATSADGSSTTRSFTIGINDQDEFDVSAISDTDAAADAVLENAANGTAVGVTAFASDSDATTNAISYSLDDDAGGRFAINSSGLLTVNGLLDHESDSSHDVTVRATSADGSFSTRVFTIAIIDVNEASTTAINDTDAASDEVAENSAMGTTVGLTAFADDADGTDIVSYSLDDNAGGRFAINSSTGAVTVAGALDAETALLHNITVRATSTDTSFTTRTFTIAILDINEFDITAISDADATADEVTENAAIGTPVGITAFADDDDATTNGITYTLDNNAGGQFAIHATSGVVTVAGAIDREAGSTRTITVRATSQDFSTTTRSFVITVNDVDEFDITPISDTDIAADNVTENAAIGTVVGITNFASDADATTNAITYTLDDDSAGQFAVNGVSGVVTVAGAIDREAGATRTITVRATSQDGSTTTQSYVIAINDVDEFDITAISDSDAATDEVTENAPIGTVVGLTAFASDADATTNGITYTLDDDAAGQFAIHSASGVVTVAGAIDREAGPTRTIIVRATSQDGSTTTQSYVIAINDVDEFDITAISDTDIATDEVAENAPIGTVVGLTAFASDADATTNSITYALDDDAGRRFVIDGVTGVVTVAGTLDYEATTSHSIIVRATSADLSSTTRGFTINVLDLNDNAPVIAAGQAFSVSEFAAVSDSLGLVFASDVDTVGSLQNWQITGGNADGIFAINAVTGEITIANTTSLDYETTPTYTLTLTVFDGVNTSASETVVIDILNINEAPVNAVPGPQTIAEDSSLVFSSTNGNAISVSDVDVGGGLLGVRLTVTNGTLTLGTTVNLSFGFGDGLNDRDMIIAGTAAELNAALAGLTYSPDANFNGNETLSIQTRDFGNSGAGGELLDDDAIVITVTPVNDVPVASDDSYSVNQTESLSVAVTGVIANDSDIDNDPLIVALVTGPAHGSLTLNADGSFTYTPDMAYFGADSFTYQIDDGTTTGNVATVNLTVIQTVGGGGGGGGDPGPVDGGDTGSGGDPGFGDGGDTGAGDPAPDPTGGPVGGPTPSDNGGGSVPGSLTTPTTLSELPTFTATQSAPGDSGWQFVSRPRSDQGRLTGYLPSDIVVNILDSMDQVLASMFDDSGVMWAKLDDMKRDMDQVVQTSTESMTLVVGTTATVGTSLTVGYVLWLLRGGTLVASMVSALPAWTMIDPLPILDSSELERRVDDDESLNSLIEGFGLEKA